MFKLRSAAFAAALLVSGAALQSAAAMPVANLAGGNAEVANAAFMLDYALSPDRPTRIERVDAEAAQAAVADYFDFDAIITLGALALAGAAMAAFTAMAVRRGAEEKAPVEPAWRATVFRAVQADLAALTETYRRAA
jgi:hypothetical protein